jgi:hypothetical protein
MFFPIGHLSVLVVSSQSTVVFICFALTEYYSVRPTLLETSKFRSLVQPSHVTRIDPHVLVTSAIKLILQRQVPGMSVPLQWHSWEL